MRSVFEEGVWRPLNRPVRCSITVWVSYHNCSSNQLGSVSDRLWRRQWQPTPVLLPGKSHGWRSLVGCSPRGCEESDMTERLHFRFHFHVLEKAMAIHSSTLAWRIPWMEEPGRTPSVGSHRVRHN